MYLSLKITHVIVWRAFSWIMVCKPCIYWTKYTDNGWFTFVWVCFRPCACFGYIVNHYLTTATVLTIPNETDPLVQDTDATGIAVGTELLQNRNGEERVVAYASWSLYTIMYYQIGIACRGNVHSAFSSLFAGTQIYSSYWYDHSSLIWLLNFKNPQGQIERWLEELSQYNMDVRHRPRSKHINADALSRMPGIY